MISNILVDNPENVDLNDLREADITVVAPSHMTHITELNF